MPVTFSVQIEGVPDPSDFEVVLSDGTTRTPVVATTAPAFEENEDATVLLLGDFGTGASGGPSPVEVRVVGELLVERANPDTGEPHDARGLRYTGPFLDLDGGPAIVAARVGPFTTDDEWLLPLGATPNHCRVSFPETTHRIQVTWSGGVTTDGTVPFTPDRTDLFVVHVVADDGAVVPSTDPAVSDRVAFLGLGDIGGPWSGGDPADYVNDGDNILDLCLRLADGFGADRIVAIETPSDPEDGTAFFDPTGDTPSEPQVFEVAVD